MFKVGDTVIFIDKDFPELFNKKGIVKIVYTYDVRVLIEDTVWYSRKEQFKNLNKQEEFNFMDW